jgi:predicted ATPase/DNA-binding transcriptional LysR family regulator
MELEARLRAFAALARRGSFSGAAEELYVSQPAVSKHLAALEAEVGKPLVARGRSGSPLTPAGELLAEYVLRAEALLANAKRALAGGAEAETGTLSIAASGVPGTYLLPEIVVEFGGRHPGVELDFDVSTSAEALEAVRAHRAELGVVGGLEVPPELDSETLLDDEVVLVGPAALGGRRLRPRELERLAWISRAEGSATRAAVETARWEMGLHGVRTLELPSWEAVKRTVAKGGGVAAISRLAIEAEVEAGTLAVLDIPRWRLTRTIVLVRARDVPLTPPAERFVALLRERLVLAEPEAPPNSNLPAQAAPLLGRERELAEAVELLRDGSRLVTFTGAGGSGKTRLALETGAALVDDFADGVYLVELAPLRDPEVVPSAIADVLLSAPEELGERLRDARMLLVLDNFEHLLDAAPLVSALLDEASELRVLATSRRPLRLKGEREYRVEPLPPDAAAELFLARAREVNPRFGDGEPVRRICERLDRLPLALELAAARARGTTAARLATLLERELPVLSGRRDAPARQRTLTAAIAWSYDLLSELQQELLASLAVFRGGCSPEAAEEVCEADAGDLTALVELGLVRVDGDGRIALLETVREFAAERLAESEAAASVHRRHAEHFLALAEHARGFARGPHEPEWLARLNVELDNLRAAFELALETGNAALGLTLAEALEPLWIRGMRQREALRWLEPLLELEGEVDTAVRAGALVVAGRSAIEGGELERAEPWLRAGLDLARKAGDDTRTAWALHALGHLLGEQGEPEQARALFEESLELFLRLGEHAPAGGRMTFLAYYAFCDGDLDRAQSLLERAVEEYRLAGDEAGVGGTIHSLGDIELARGELALALDRYREAHPLLLRSASSFDLAYMIGAVAAVAAQGGRRDVAGRLWGAFDRLHNESERMLEPETHALLERNVGALDPADVEAGRALSEDEAVALAQRTADDLAASLRSRLARTSGHSSSRTE